MSAFITAKSGSRDWDLPVLSAGAGEAIAAFTSAARATEFLQGRRLDHDHEVSEVSALELIEVMVAAHEDGVTYLAINPDKHRQLAGACSRILSIDPKLAEFAADLTSTALQASSFTTN